MLLFYLAIIAAIGYFPQAVKNLEENSPLEQKTARVTIFIVLFITFITWPRTEIASAFALLFVTAFRFLDGYGFGRVFTQNWRGHNLSIVMGSIFSMLYGWLLYKAYTSAIINSWLWLLIALSFAFKCLALVGLSRFIFDLSVDKFSRRRVVILMICANVIALTSFIGKYEYNSQLNELFVLAMMPMGFIVRRMS